MFVLKKKNQQACFDLTPYYGLEFELEAPSNAEAAFTLTQKTLDCSDRLEGRFILLKL